LALFGVLFFIPSLLYIIDGKDEKLGAKTWEEV
jgi:hypothetical protein